MVGSDPVDRSEVNTNRCLAGESWNQIKQLALDSVGQRRITPRLAEGKVKLREDTGPHEDGLSDPLMASLRRRLNFRAMLD
jgi:hypothetical protein